MSDEWVEKTSRSTGKTYWYNYRTKESTWKCPAVMQPVFRPISPPWVDMPEDTMPVYECHRSHANHCIHKWVVELQQIVMNRCRSESVLDLLCGSGRNIEGTILGTTIARYRGMDNSDSNIQRAIRTYSTLPRIRPVLVDFTWCKQEWDRLLAPNNNNNTFDVVSVYFHFQRYCRTKKQVTEWLRSVKNVLSSKGYVVLTIPSADRVRAHIMDNSATLSPGVHISAGKTWKNKFGSPYTVSIHGWLAEQTAYLCPLDDLRSIANKCGFRAVTMENVKALVKHNPHDPDNPSVLWDVFCLFDIVILQWKK